MLRLTSRELLAELRSPFAAERLVDAGPTVVVTGGPEPEVDQVPAAVARLASLPIVVVGIAQMGLDGAGSGVRRVEALCDVVVAHDDPHLAAVLATVDAHPIASAALVVLLRNGEGRSLGAGLAAESAVYSLLQAGPEFAAWRAGRSVRAADADPGAAADEPTVIASRDGDLLHLTLNRPGSHNAFNSTMRDQLIESLLVAAADASVTRIVLDGAGPSFCSGGDLDEFGSFADPASAHLVRLAASAARVLAEVADRTEVHLHGSCLGSGIELSALASSVVAHPDVSIGLPEIGLGLIPGAGGTASLPPRIGRHRTAYLALSDCRLDAETARAWGLVDSIVE